MKQKTGYIITEENAGLVANISGMSLVTIKVNQGWVAVFQENPYPNWSLMPRNVAEKIKGFEYVDSSLNGLPARSVEEIQKEWTEVNTTYSEKLESLRKELERANLRDEMRNGRNIKA